MVHVAWKLPISADTVFPPKPSDGLPINPMRAKQHSEMTADDEDSAEATTSDNMAAIANRSKSKSFQELAAT
jgi:hypothetical protein